jgi:hypothetical protein
LSGIESSHETGARAEELAVDKDFARLRKKRNEKVLASASISLKVLSTFSPEDSTKVFCTRDIHTFMLTDRFLKVIR